MTDLSIPQKNLNSCPECGNKSLICDDTRGEIVCNDCGLVLDQRVIDSGPEWRAFTSEEANRKVRVGAPTTLTLHDKGLSTMIGWKNKDAFGKAISPKMKAEVYRLRKWHVRTRTNKSIDRNLAYAMNELDRFASQLNLSKDIKESAAHIYRKMANKNLIRGRSIEAMLIASIYLSCRLNNVPKTLDDFIEFASVDKKKIARCYRLILNELKLNIHVSSPINFIPRFCADLKLSGRTQNRAASILELAKMHRITAGKAPTGLAGAALYVAAIQEGERRTQKEISIAAGVTEATIRNRYKELVNHLKFDLNI
ncbi:MAG: transcription initiation factor IIB [Promethearchaeota archaeon]